MDRISNSEYMLLIEAVCTEQVSMIVGDYNSYNSDKYNALEKLKIKLSKMRKENED